MDDMEDEFLFYVILIFSIVGVFAFCSFGCFCCFVFYRKRAARTTYSSKWYLFIKDKFVLIFLINPAPVVVTGQTYQPPEQPAYAVNLQTTQVEANQNQSMTHHPINTQFPQPTLPTYQPQMPMPYQNVESQSNQSFPYNPQFQQSTTGYLPQSSENNDGRDDIPPSYHKIDKLWWWFGVFLGSN